ncbi:MAG: GMC family oxidoreductase N-terminal domain-containing protein [Flavobacteriales bacterium]|nr:GMC family oxidoreductase N-terminal domain-containing protein [Flavobacteriales bacterium]
MSKDSHFDIVIIGSGPGGTTAAKIISENTNLSIAVVEEGGKAEETIKMGSFDDLTNRYRYGGAEIVYSKPNISIAEGKVVGGGSQINSGIYHRIPDEVLKNWIDQFKIKNFDMNLINHSYNYIENWLNIDLNTKSKNDLSNKLIDGAKYLDLEAFQSKTWNLNDISNIKHTMSASFYNIQNSVKLFEKTTAKKILFDKNQNAVSVECLHNNKKIKIHFKMLIIAGGTIQTPLLLKKSGYKFLDKITFNIHPHIKVGANFENELHNESPVSDFQIKVDEFSSSLGSSINTSQWKALFLLDNWFNFYNPDLLNNLDKFGVFYSMVKPSGMGRINFLPKINSYFLTYKYSSKDKFNLQKSLSLLIDLLFKVDANNVFLPNKKINKISRDEPFEESVITNNFNYFNAHSVHIFSSLRLGERNSECSSDGYLKMSKNVMIADSSLIPGPPGVNPQGSLMSLVAKNIFSAIERGEIK